jgi:DMSO reductase iron-sulfur subunit
MNLPLLESALAYTRVAPDPRWAGSDLESPPLIPARAPDAGEQYRFHFDMQKCIGCKCCVVACNEQNGNPAAIQWRRVGEVEGGHFPLARRYHLSMGCNHCLEPSCMIGCPVEAYTKDPLTGIVLHSADTCIGCQYCVWNCSYGVPQYNPERGVVGKCDLCHNRLSDGLAPACAAACPETAIRIEIVNIEQWRQDYLAADAPGLPSAHDSISTTRITVPNDAPPDTGRVDTQRIHPEPAHWPLVFMLVLTQLAVGAFTALWLLDAVGTHAGVGASALAAMAVAVVSLAASALHLGRPVYAWRALRGWRRSWLSREILGLSGFAAVASLFAAMLFLNLPARASVGLLTAISGALGVYCSARIYMVNARPAWKSVYTAADFFATALLLGPLFVHALGIADHPWLRYAAIGGAAAQLLVQSLKFLRLARSEQFELRASAILLSGRFQTQFLLRLGILVIAGIVLPLVEAGRPAALLTLLLALAGEWLGRWLFFVSVVPKNIAAAFTTAGRHAA